jgi:prophage regulatory protein
MEIDMLKTFDDLPDSALIRCPLVLTLTGLSRATLHRRIKQGKFPRGVQLGENSVAWRAGDIRRWLNERQAA